MHIGAPIWMHGENGLDELSKMPSRHAECADEKCQKRPIFATPKASGQPKQQQKANADAQRHWKFVVEGVNLQ